MGAISIEAVHKVYPGGHTALRGIDLAVADGELVVLVGPSGCGKSTLLRLVAGLESPSGGRIRIGARDVTALEPGARDVAMVFQSYALYPHKSVRENLAFGLRVRREPAARIEQRVAAAAQMLGLAGVLERRPAQLSGGQRQRVALGRALVREPQAFLLDEPLSNLDAGLRARTRSEIARLHRRLGATMLYVTHDQEEAMTLGQRLAVMRSGRIEQLGPPLEVYQRPATAFVAEFIGTPEINWLGGRLALRGGQVELEGPGGSVSLPAGVAPDTPRSRELRWGIRPHELEIVRAGEGDLDARVELLEPLGAAVLVHAETPVGACLRALAPAASALRPAEPIGLRLPRTGLHWFDAESGQRLL
jgi:multiple sugar transport system ATP-binding protein